MSSTPLFKTLLCTLALILAVALPPALAQQNDHENPDLYPGAWFRISLGNDGSLITGDGDGYNGGAWSYYPQTGWYRQWFYNQPFTTEREGYLKYEVYIKAVDRTRLTYVEVNFNWTTPEWSKLGLNRPPLADDVPTAEDEARYMASRRVYLVDNWYIGTIEPIYSHIIKEYNPEWISIDVRGQNAYLYRGAMHQCRARQGACCNHETGECTLTYEDECPAPLEWLGAESTCDACTKGDGGLDFGDAPDTYRTLLGSDGPRHMKVTGVFLGKSVDVEAQGKPDSMALGDDAQVLDDEDGITFTSPLLPGASAAFTATASTSGYLNAWVDFNRDGDFADADEQIFADQLLAPGANHLSFRVPSTALQGATFARFRYNTRGLLTWYGVATDGEVEDYQVTIAAEFEPQTNSGKGGVKWSQEPQRFDAATPFIFNAWSERSDLNLHRIAADDWETQDELPVTGFQWWGSFQGWSQPLLPTQLPLAYHITMWTDSSAKSDGVTGSHPDTLVWEKFCTDWTWSLAGYHSDPAGTGDNTCFQFTCMLSQNEWFTPTVPQGKDGASVPAVYWLSIAVIYDALTSTPSYPWAWSTRPQYFNNGAVQIATIAPADGMTTSWPPSPGSRWLAGDQIENPRGTAWDLAFELLTSQSSAASAPGLAPVYRFWSDKLGTHFYTINEAEKDGLIREQSQAWTYEGIAFYAYPPDRAPVGSKPVYRFWSGATGRHFYTISEAEKQALIEKFGQAWADEGVAWYAFE